ncbi:amidohydrolase [Parvularcula marina]|uniref:Amidohydrolase n=1 Tax=Parvularcula marina TaxID=2292771 RepID=A0A371RKH0_9PROT|nr:amidohydrolase [Parvularcula marina]RFB05965.1 amidohydrolase [Parvularcula marina]
MSIRHSLAAGLLLIATPAFADPVSDAVDADLPDLIELYKHLHANPELSNEETETAARMAAELRELGFEVTEGVGGTGVVGMLKNGEGPVVLIRADMDGLPVTEETGLPYASKKTATLANGVTTGVMHACGHDVHMTTWVGTARYLAGHKDEWAGTLMMIAQPAEEVGQGARAMLADGLYERFPTPDHAIALHDAANALAGTIGVGEGFVMANVDSVDITVYGSGGHGAYPHTTVDPIVIAARIVDALQTLVSRETNPQTAAVVTVGSFHAGAKHNIIPNEAKLQLTVRSYSDETRDHLLKGIRRIAYAQALSAGLAKEQLPKVEVKDEYTPALYNTPEQTSRLKSLFTERFGADGMYEVTPVMGGEDFSQYHRYDREVEATLFRLGAVKADAWEAAGGDATKLPGLHSAKFAPDPEPTLRAGTEAMIAAALELFSE